MSFTLTLYSDSLFFKSTVTRRQTYFCSLKFNDSKKVPSLQPKTEIKYIESKTDIANACLYFIYRSPNYRDFVFVNTSYLFTICYFPLSRQEMHSSGDFSFHFLLFCVFRLVPHPLLPFGCLTGFLVAVGM